MRRNAERCSQPSRRIDVANLRKCLLEIRERLGPLIKELGLRQRLGMKHGEFWLHIERRDENGVVWKAPVFFVFPPASSREDIDDTWSSVRVGLSEPIAKPVGTNGWVCFEGQYEYEGEPIGPKADIRSVEQALELAASTLQDFPLVPDDVVDGVIECHCLSWIWDDLRMICDDRGVEQVHVKRDEKGYESFYFDHGDRMVEMRCIGDNVQFFLNGELLASAYHYNRREVRDAMAWTFEQIDEEVSRKPKS
jgi:hypothetical protein